MKLIRQIYNYVVFIQFFMLVIFLILNFDSLSNIVVDIPIGTWVDSDSVSIPNISITFSFYTLIGVIVILTGFILLFSVNVLQSGLNEFGSSTLGKFVYHTVSYVILMVPTSVYLLNLNIFGGIIGLLITLVWFFQFFESLSNNESSE